MELRQNYTLRGNTKPQSHIITVGGGKGGIGKSFISSSIAIFLANQGYRTVLVDLDLGCANLHTYLGLNKINKGISNFLNSNDTALDNYIIPTSFPQLGLITTNDPDNFDSSQINILQKSKLMSALFKLKADYIIFDLSAGTTETTLDFYLMGNSNILVTTPEPSSIENAYRFLKSSFYRKLKRIENQMGIKDTVAHLMSNKEALNIKSPYDLLKAIYMSDKEKGEQLMRNLSQFSPYFILNQTRSPRDISLGYSIKSVCHKYFGLKGEFLGHVDHDNAVWQSLRNRKHLLVEYPHSQLYAQLMNITRAITKKNEYLNKVA